MDDEPNPWLHPQQLRHILSTELFCIASNRVLVDGNLVGYMYRESPSNEDDSGWRFLCGDESDSYMATTQNHRAVPLNTMANYDTAIIPYLEWPIGTGLQRDSETFEFEQVEWGDDLKRG